MGGAASSRAVVVAVVACLLVASLVAFAQPDARYEPGPAVRIDFEGSAPAGPVRSAEAPPPVAAALPYAAGPPVRIDFVGNAAAPPSSPAYVAGPPIRVDFEGSHPR